MKISPASGQAFVIEDVEDFSSFEKAGLVIPEEAKKGVGTTGVIHAIHRPQIGFFSWLKRLMFGDVFSRDYREGDRVIFDRFIANDIYIRDELGKEIPRLRCVPIDCILGLIHVL